MKYLKTYLENYHDELQYIGIIYNELNFNKLLNLGYEYDEKELKNITKYIYIQIQKDGFFGMLYFGLYNPGYDLIININDIPERKDLDEYVNFLRESDKLGVM